MPDASTSLAVPTSIRARRKRLGWTQAQLAEKVGVSSVTIHNLEAGKNGFTDKTLAQLAAALGCAPSDLLVDPDEGNRSVRDFAEIRDLIERIDLDDRGLNLVMMAIETAMQAGYTKSGQPLSGGQRDTANRLPAEEPSE